MSIPTRSPLRMAGTGLSSGGVGCGEFVVAIGGDRAVTFYSGAVAPGLTGAPAAVAVGSDVLIFSGAGRLKTILQHQVMQSGLAVLFYDAGAPVSGGPIYTSGHKVIGRIEPTWNAAATAATVPASGVGAGFFLNSFKSPLQVVDIPFQSGLCFNSASGQPGFTATYVPETNSTLPQ